MLGKLVLIFIFFCAIKMLHIWLFDPRREAPKQYAEYRRQRQMQMSSPMPSPSPMLIMADLDAEPKPKKKQPKQLNLFNGS